METLINECVQWRSTTISKLDYTEWEWEKNSKSEQRWPDRTIQYQRKRHKQKQYDRGIVASTRKIVVLPNKAKSMCMSIVIAWLLACHILNVHSCMWLCRYSLCSFVNGWVTMTTILCTLCTFGRKRKLTEERQTERKKCKNHQTEMERVSTPTTRTGCSNRVIQFAKNVLTHWLTIFLTFFIEMESLWNEKYVTDTE